jgi:hypothetical protein
LRGNCSSKSLWGKSPDQLADVFRKTGSEVTIAQSAKGSKLSTQIQIKRLDIQEVDDARKRGGQ